jgi:hypothetical protein
VLYSDPNALQSFVAQLRSGDVVKRREQARTLASVASPSLEDVLLGFADNSEFRQFALLAFHRMNTRLQHESLGGFADENRSWLV